MGSVCVSSCRCCVILSAVHAPSCYFFVEVCVWC